MYISNDGKYLLQGSLIDLKTRVDISEERRDSIRLDALNDLGEENMIIFPAKDEKHIITVFTDIDCGYCRKLHAEMDKYNEEGITVRYLMFPRAGIDSPSYEKAVSVWCSKDKQDAMTRSKLGETLPKASCDNPIKEEYELGQLIGVRGTPRSSRKTVPCYRAMFRLHGWPRHCRPVPDDQTVFADAIRSYSNCSGVAYRMQVRGVSRTRKLLAAINIESRLGWSSNVNL